MGRGGFLAGDRRWTLRRWNPAASEVVGCEGLCDADPLPILSARLLKEFTIYLQVHKIRYTGC
jgi:hypothetical protein